NGNRTPSSRNIGYSLVGDISVRGNSSFAGNPGLKAAQAVINALPIDHRYILQLYSDGYSSSEIALAVERPAGTVRSICSRLLAAIRAAYEKVMLDNVPAKAASSVVAADRDTGSGEKYLPIPKVEYPFEWLHVVPCIMDWILNVLMLRLLCRYGTLYR
ncbi:MAG: hypothetical protein AABZ39_17280, partial [Spirochaetota bacterium]